MPELNVAATTASAVVANASPSPEAGNGDAAEGQLGIPFAVVLQQAALGTAAAGKPAIDLLAAADVQASKADDAGAAENAELAAILPVLTAIAASADAGVTDTSASPVAAEAGEEPLEFAALPTAAPIEAPKGNGPSPVSALPAGQERAALLNHGQAALLNHPQAATQAAITAASPAKVDASAIADAAQAPRQGGFEELLSAAREVQPQAPGMAAMAGHAGANAPTSAAIRVETPVGARGWDAEVGNRLVWMTGRQESHAELVLNPPQMGRIEVSLSISGDQASALFVSASPAVREALENALPRLREVLADAGVTLGQAQVGSESAGHSADKREKGDNPPHGTMHSALAGGVPGTAAGIGQAGNPWLKAGRGLVDVFA